MKQVAVGDDQVGVLAKLDGADAVVHAEHPGGLDRDRAQARQLGEPAADGEASLDREVQEVLADDAAQRDAAGGRDDDDVDAVLVEGRGVLDARPALAEQGLVLRPAGSGGHDRRGPGPSELIRDRPALAAAVDDRAEAEALSELRDLQQVRALVRVEARPDLAAEDPQGLLVDALLGRLLGLLVGLLLLLPGAVGADVVRRPLQVALDLQLPLGVAVGVAQGLEGRAAHDEPVHVAALQLGDGVPVHGSGDARRQGEGHVLVVRIDGVVEVAAAAEEPEGADGDQARIDPQPGDVDDLCVLGDVHVVAEGSDLALADQEGGVPQNAPEPRVDLAAHEGEDLLLVLLDLRLLGGIIVEGDVRHHRRREEQGGGHEEPRGPRGAALLVGSEVHHWSMSPLTNLPSSMTASSLVSG